MSEIIKKFKVLNKLKEEFLNEIKLSYIFKNNNVLIVTNDDKVFAFGSNNNGVLGFGNDREVNELTINEDLSHKQIIDFKNSDCHVVARTIDGKVYCWGYNIFGVLGNGKNDRVIYSPKLNQYLSDKQIIDICCGFRHTLVLTNSGEVYAWGDNKKGQIGNGKSGENECQLIPIKVNGFNDEKVIHISCGGWHSMALTESGRVFSWGNNSSRQLGQNNNKNAINQPTFVSLNNEISIKKISCGLEHSLLLSREAHLYWFGNNGIEKQMTPKKLTINTNKLIDIASHYNHYISIALSMNGIYYIWGNCGEIEKIKEPKETEFKSFDDIFNHYFGITYKTLNFSENTINLQNLENGKYEKEFEEKRLIGCGSFGIVHKAIGRSNGKVYAIKKIAFNDKDIEKVSKELNLITELKCNFVVGFINYWVEDNCIKAGDCIRDNKDNTLYSNESISYGHPVYNPNNTLLLHIQMEFCSKTFKQLMTELNISQSLDIINFYILCELFIELLECLNYLHSLKPPVIHRDLKPENILITDGMNGRFVKLCDFGLAVIHEFEDQSHSSRTGSFKYMAPEVFKRHYDMKADVYSLGIILQELFDLEK
jgi:alpha-tubulin suppressor-like RCC1 family protein